MHEANRTGRRRLKGLVIQLGRQTDRQADRQTGMHTGKETNGRVNTGWTRKPRDRIFVERVSE